MSNSKPNAFDPGAVSPYGGEHEIVSRVSSRVFRHYFHNESAEFSVRETPYCGAECLPRHPLKHDEKDYRKLLRCGHLTYLVGTQGKHFKDGWINQEFLPGDFVVSLHMNAGQSETSGCEVLYSNEAPEIRRRQAVAASAAVASVLKIRDRGAKSDSDSARGDLTILDDTFAPALLIELGFVTNINDAGAVRERGAEAVIAALHAIRGVR